MRLFRARWRARLLVQSLIERLAIPTTFEFVDGDILVKSACTVRTEAVIINIVSRRLRLLDSIYVRYCGLEIWVPLLARLRLRRVVRCVLAEKTQDGLVVPSMEL